MKVQTLNISLPVPLVQLADKVAQEEYQTRSDLIREALRIYLSRLVTWQKIRAIGRRAAKRAGVKSEEDVNRIVYEFRHGAKN